MKKVISIVLLPVLGLLFYFLYHCGIRIPCLFYEITGYYCPGCGMSRAIYALMHFHWQQAFFLNPLGLILFPFLLCYIQYQLICWGFDKQDQITKRIPKGLLYGIIIIAIVYGVMRNMSDFAWMAPIGEYKF